MTLGDRVVVMKDGLMQQCASPLEVYERPVNRFVAGFVGTPPMNFFTGRLLAESGHVYFDEGTNRIRLPEDLAASLASRGGDPMVLGVRPECLSNRNDGAFAGTENAIDVKVSVVELLGDKKDVYTATQSHDHIVCRVDSHAAISEGQSASLYLNMGRVHLFEPGETGMNVSLDGVGASAR
jgi:multiple sugar transport system ATP-binding protein